MKHTALTATGLALLFGAGPALAQEEAPAEGKAAVELGAIDIEDTRAPLPAYRGLIAEDSGLSVIDEESLDILKDGSGDATDMLRILPNVHFDTAKGAADRDSLLDLRPSDISISGGQIYDNSIRLDGVAVDSVMDVSNDNPFSLNEVAGAAAQTIFVNPSLIGGIEVRDSNISARFGEFSGGVVDMTIRDPAADFGAEVGYSLRNDDLTEYIVAEGTDPNAADAPPEYTRWEGYGTVDLPVSDRLKLLLGFQRLKADVKYPVSDNYGGGLHGRHSTSDQYLLKGLYEFSDALRLTSTLIYSPYEFEGANANGYDNLIVSNGGGLTFKTELAGETGQLDWLVRASYVDSDMSREAPPYNFSWSSSAPSIDFCSSTNCTTGGFGDLEQYQKDYTLEAELSHPLFGGRFDFGGEAGLVNAYKSREEASGAYLSSSVSPDTVCADPDDVACIDGEVALTAYLAYESYKADIEIMQGALWAEQNQSFGPVDVRAGLRLSTDDFMDNTNLAPRFSAVWNINDRWQLTGGLNRYYTRNFVGYAIREEYQDNYRYVRSPEIVDGQRIFYNDWELSRHSVPTSYRNADLSTPYSDEATLALTFPAFGAMNGLGRLKVVQRWHRDQIVSLARVSEDEPDGEGGSFTRRIYRPSNAGETDYIGISGEWTGSWRNTSLVVNAEWSDTTNNSDAIGAQFDVVDEEEQATEFVIYKGTIMSEAELQDRALRENFATPLQANVGIISRWLDNRLKTAIWLNWKGEYETIGDSGVNETVDGVAYDVFEDVTRKAALRTDLNVTYDLPVDVAGRIQLEARASNLFNEEPYVDVSVSQPYQLGRLITLGINWKY